MLFSPYLVLYLEIISLVFQNWLYHWNFLGLNSSSVKLGGCIINSFMSDKFGPGILPDTHVLASGIISDTSQTVWINHQPKAQRRIQIQPPRENPGDEGKKKVRDWSARNCLKKFLRKQVSQVFNGISVALGRSIGSKKAIKGTVMSRLYNSLQLCPAHQCCVVVMCQV